MAYATVLELTAELGHEPLAAQSLLDRASRDIDATLLCSIYDVDEDGNPTDADVIDALRVATIEQVLYQLEQGNRQGVRHGLLPGVPSSTSAGEVDLSRGQSVGGSTTALPRLGEQPWTTLQSAGLVPQGPIPL
jgi:hypothetical protein